MQTTIEEDTERCRAVTQDFINLALCCPYDTTENRARKENLEFDSLTFFVSEDPEHASELETYPGYEGWFFEIGRGCRAYAFNRFGWICIVRSNEHRDGIVKELAPYVGRTGNDRRALKFAEVPANPYSTTQSWDWLPVDYAKHTRGFTEWRLDDMADNSLAEALRFEVVKNVASCEQQKSWLH